MKKRRNILFCLLLCSLSCLYAQQEVESVLKRAEHLSVNYVFKLYGQTRRYAMNMEKQATRGVQIDWTIFSYQKWLKGSYIISPKGLCCGSQLSFKQPQHGAREQLNDNETFGLISVSAFDNLIQKEQFTYSQTTYRLKEQQQIHIGEHVLNVLYVVADIDHTEMWIWNNRDLPVICKIENNPLEINFYIEKITDKELK